MNQQNYCPFPNKIAPLSCLFQKISYSFVLVTLLKVCESTAQGTGMRDAVIYDLLNLELSRHY